MALQIVFIRLVLEQNFKVTVKMKIINLLIPLPNELWSNIFNHYAEKPNDLRNCKKLTPIQKQIYKTFEQFNTKINYDQTEFKKLPQELQTKFNRIFEMYGE
jgi:hypothetical protein